MYKTETGLQTEKKKNKKPYACKSRVSLVAQTVKNLPAVWETWVPSLGREDALEEHMATRSRILAWSIPMDRGAWWPAVHGVAKGQTRLCG